MTMINVFLKELEAESKTTKKMLSIVPNDKYDWKPHPKSMNIRSLATHIAELPTWIKLALTTDGLDFASAPYDPEVINSTNELLDLFERSLVEAKEHLVAKNENVLNETWTLRNGEAVYSTDSKAETIRHALSQIIHHRAQLGVNLRLLNIPIPGSYGPSADENNF
jgi:uncharacterized damage-inducible protein DinB